MHIWRERRSVLGLRGQHARNQSLSIKSGSGDEATITPNIKRSSKPKRQAGKLKQCIAELPMVTAQKPKEELIMYLCTSWGAISAVLLAERDSRQISIYFVSCTLQTIEINYNLMEKLVLAIVHATRRLRRSSCLEGSGARLILTSPEGRQEFTYALRFKFDASNNEAEYEALVAGLQIAEKIGMKNMAAKVDSRLVANQINGLYEAKEQSMTQYLEKTKTLINSFEIFLIEQVSRSENKKEDELSKIASSPPRTSIRGQILADFIAEKPNEEGPSMEVQAKEAIPEP
ncbi:reverse transcriptase domain-containing protein [Tanacetum coccineum]